MLEPHELYAGLRFTYLLADQYRFPGSWVYAESRVPYSLMRLITRGTADFHLDGHLLQVTAGDDVHIPEGTLLAGEATSGEIEFVSVRFITSVKLGDSDFLSAYYGIPYVTGFGDDADIRSNFLALHEAAQGASPARGARWRGAHQRGQPSRPDSDHPIRRTSRRRLPRGPEHGDRHPHPRMVRGLLPPRCALAGSPGRRARSYPQGRR